MIVRLSTLVFAGALFAGACKSPPKSTTTAPATIDDASRAASSDAGDVRDAELDVDAADATTASCGPTKLQPKACITSHADLVLANDAIRAWLEARGAKTREYTFERCREVVLGDDRESVLVCIDMAPRAMDPSMGIDGPVEHRFDLDVVTVRAGARVELLRIPFAFGMSNADQSSYSEMLFSARYRVDPRAGALDVEATPEECAAAIESLKPYFGEVNAELRANTGIPAGLRAQLIRANDLERVADADRIRATCAARGRYLRGRDGRFAR